MAQPEDTELRDLVIDALERNGSLAKIRALLRANIFLAFEDDCENLKQNVILDNILKVPEGTIALSIIHEFLEYCNLKNTLFVYMSESRQGNQYKYDGKKKLAEKLHLLKSDNLKEPILLTLVKNNFKQQKYFEQTDKHNKCDSNCRDEQNSTYIIHEDSQSSSTSNSNSDNSSDEKNKLHLRLHLENSDTDTSSDSVRGHTSSEYIPGDHIIDTNNIIGTGNTKLITENANAYGVTNLITPVNQTNITSMLSELKLATSSNDSTSYADLKPFNALDEKLLNTTGLPSSDIDIKDNNSSVQLDLNIPNECKNDSAKTLSSVSSLSKMKEKGESSDKKSPESAKSEIDTADYSLDFTSSPSKINDRPDRHVKSSKSVRDKEKSSNINKSTESPYQSSRSSVSLSDVADLISEKSFSHHTHNDRSHDANVKSSESKSKEKVDSKQNKSLSDDSGDFTESPIPSLSNLSLDIHSD